MADNVIRHDVVQIGFDIDNNPLKQLTKEVEAIKKLLGSSLGDDAFEDMGTEADKAEDEVEKLKKTVHNTTEEVEDLGEKAENKGFNGLKKMASVSFKALSVGITAASGAIVALVTQSVKAYADFEQLKGGVETLFGAKGAQNVEEYAQIVGKSVKDAKDEYGKLKEVESLVIGHANDAYKTAGMSANDYMETVTGFSASLIASLDGDTETAALLANQAIIDMSDNANKMGSDLENVKAVYSGLAKGQFMLLDNLKLGYGGTKTEMERLLKDAQKIKASQGETVSYSIDSFADLVEAIHVVQDEMYITGTTQKEAEKTITGSALAMKAAWGNMLPALIQGGDSFEQCVNNLVDSAKIFMENIKEPIKTALSGIGSLIVELAGMLEKEFPTLVDELLPPLIQAATALLVGVIKALPAIVKTVAKEIPNILKELSGGIIKAFYEGFTGKEMQEESAKGAQKAVSIIIGSLTAGVAGVVAFKKGKGIFDGLKGLFGKTSETDETTKGIKKTANSFEQLAKTKVTTVLKGLANVAIIVGGMTVLAAALALVAPYIAKLSDGKSMLETIAIIGAVGILGGALAKVAGSVGNIPVSTVLKGLANIAIIIGGTALLTILIGLMSMIKFDFKKMTKVVVALGVIGVLGGVLAVIAGIVGVIPVSTVALGLANIAIIIGGTALLTILLGLVSMFKFDFKKMTKVAIAMGVIGVLGGVLSVIAGVVGVIPFPVVLAGLANIATALGGFGLIVAAFGALSKIPGLSEFLAGGGKLMSQLSGILGDIIGSFIGGALGGAIEQISNSLPTLGENIAKFMTTIGSGFASFKGVDGASVGAFFKSFGLFLVELAGAELLTFLTGDLDLPALGTELSGFMDKAYGFFEKVQTIDKSAFTNTGALFKALAGSNDLPKDGGFIQAICGSINWKKLAVGLVWLSHENVIKFYDMIGGYTQQTFDNIGALFKALAGSSDLPKDGGFIQTLCGSIDYKKIAVGLKWLSHEKAVRFYDIIGTYTKKTFTNMTSLFNALADIKGLPKEGGIQSWGSGKVNLASIGESLGAFGEKSAKFFEVIVSVTPENMDVVPLIWDAIEGASGVVDCSLEGLYKKGIALSNLATHLKPFFATVATFNGKYGYVTLFNNCIWDALKFAGEIIDKPLGGLFKKGIALTNFMNSVKGFFVGAGEVSQYVDAVKSVTSTLKTFFSGLGDMVVENETFTKSIDKLIAAAVNKFGELPTKIANAIKGSGSALADSFVSVWTQAVIACATPINKLIDGANWILKQFEANKVMPKWVPYASYANGTGGHQGGNALVNDGRGAELVQMPNGKAFIPKGKNVFIPNAPKGMKVLPAEQTAQLMGKSKPIFKYAEGTGAFDIYDYMDNEKGLLSKVKDKFVSYGGLSGLKYDISKAMVDMVSTNMLPWVKKVFDEYGIGKNWKWPSATHLITSRFGPRKSPGGIGSTYHQGIDIGAPMGSPVLASKGGRVTMSGWYGGYGKAVIIDHGKGWSTIYAHNSSLLAAAGSRVRQGQTIAQVGSTGNSTGPHIHFGLSRNGGYIDPLPHLQGYANGGLVTKTGMIAENPHHPEWVIPTDPTKRDRALNLYRKAGQSLGLSAYTPENSTRSYGSSEAQTTEYNTYSPQFNLTINGSDNPRALERQVKKWIEEKMNDMFDTMERKNPKVVEV